MAATNRPARLNRGVLGLLGLILLVAGTFGMAAGLGGLRAVRPSFDPTAPLLPPGVQVQSWVPYAAVAAAVVVGLLCVRWLLAQALRRPSTRTWRLHHDGAQGITLIDADTAADALAADIQAYLGVATARATITGTRTRPNVHLEVATEENTSVTELRERIASHALPRLHQALQIDTAAANLVLHLDTTRTSATRRR